MINAYRILIGRFRHTWDDDIKMALREIQCEVIN
jgi:hypothetical protein